MAKGGNRQLRSVRNMAAPPPAPWSPDLTQCQPYEYVVTLVGQDARVMVRHFYDDRDRIVDFAMVLQRWVGPEGDDWADVLQVDCDHGEVHVHRFGSSGEQTSRTTFCTLAGPDDVTAGCDYAEDLILGGWEEHLRRWEFGR
jgi:hypothetical protein